MEIRNREPRRSQSARRHGVMEIDGFEHEVGPGGTILIPPGA